MSGEGDRLPTKEVRDAATSIAGAALAYVQEPATKRVRVEDYLTALGAITGEAALLSAGVLDLETTELVPGSAIFGDAINVVLTGPDPAHVDPASVVGTLMADLVPDVYPASAFDSIADLYRHVVATVGSSEWGSVALSVPDANRPTVIPLRAAFELRPAVDAAIGAAHLPGNERYLPCALGLVMALRQVQGAIDPRIALRLALEVVFGMAKMVPMSRRRFEEARLTSSGG